MELSESEIAKEVPQPSSIRQVVEVVAEGAPAEEALETIKKDAQEIEEVVETLEETVGAISKEETAEDETVAASETEIEEDEERQKEVVDSLYQRSEPSFQPEITVHKRGASRSLVVWAGLTIGIAVVVGGVLVVAVRGKSVPSSFLRKTAPTPTSTSAPTPTPVSLDRKDITIQVFNGGGVAGAAGKMKKFLEEKGYTVSSVGNTDEYTYEQTEIHVKAAKSAYFNLLSQDLQADYDLGSSSADLSQDASYDARVIVGKK